MSDGGRQGQRVDGYTQMQDVSTQSHAPSGGARRMRRLRERRRRGDVMVSLDVGPGAIAALIKLGWLPEDYRGDKGVVTRALIDIYDRAIQVRLTPSVGSQDRLSFVCELDLGEISGLVQLRWLQGSQQDDHAAVENAFRRFVRYALNATRNTVR